jgi:Ca2+-binding RTX toxin-like protein
MRKIFVALGALGALWVVPAPAIASTIAEHIPTASEPACLTGLTGPLVNPYCVVYTAAGGESNKASISLGSLGNVTVNDSGATISTGVSSPGTGLLPCVALLHSASCLSQWVLSNPSLGLNGILVNGTLAAVVALLGDGNDTLAFAAAASLWADGGPGDDQISTSGVRFSHLIGGAGADVLNAGANGEVSYVEDHPGPVSVSLDGVANDGSPGEHDNVFARYVTTGGGDDTLTGSPGADSLSAGSGNNTVIGGDGNDELHGSGTIDGGSGNDLIEGGDGGLPNLFTGGPGDDVIDAGKAANSIVDAGPGNDHTVALGEGSVVHLGDGDDSVNAWGNVATHQTVDCGPGDDTVIATAGDSIAADCEHVEFRAVT